MTVPERDRDPEVLGPEELPVAAALRSAPPSPGDGLRRRVHHTVVRALEERQMRRQAAMLVVAGVAMLVLAAVAGLTAPG